MAREKEIAAARQEAPKKMRLRRVDDAEAKE